MSEHITKKDLQKKISPLQKLYSGIWDFEHHMNKKIRSTIQNERERFYKLYDEIENLSRASQKELRTLDKEIDSQVERFLSNFERA